MSVIVEVSISDELVSEVRESGDDDVPEPELLQTWAAAAYLKNKPAVASMRVTTTDEIKKLNQQYRDKNKATNVLSFPMQSPDDVDLCLLGDIVLCAEIIEYEARQQSKNTLSHWAHMVIHGMLHLQGYDHINDEEAAEMEELEINILNQLGFNSPYESRL